MFLKMQYFIILVMVLLLSCCGYSPAYMEVSTEDSSRTEEKSTVSQNESPTENGIPPIILSFESYQELKAFAKIKDNFSTIKDMSFYKNFGDVITKEEYYSYLKEIEELSFPLIDDYDSVYYFFYTNTDTMFINYSIDGVEIRFAMNITDESFDSVLAQDTTKTKEIKVTNVSRACIKDREGELFIIFEEDALLNRFIAFVKDEKKDVMLEWFKELKFVPYKQEG